MGLIGRRILVNENDKQCVKEVLDSLNAVKVRCTYGALGGLLGVPPWNVAKRYLGDRRPRASWVVNQRERTPTGFSHEQMHPDLLKYEKIICKEDELDELRKKWKRSVPLGRTDVVHTSSSDGMNAPERDPPSSVTVVVLAAGQGWRMNSSRPKVLQSLAGRPMLSHALDAAEALGPDTLNIVYGHGGGAVRNAFADRDLIWTHQPEQLGTGHALAQALPSIPDGNRVLVLCGDMPLISATSLERLIEQTDGQGLGLLTATVDEPSGYGRVLRDEVGSVAAVVEDSDASPEELAVKEVNTGVMVLPAEAARRWLGRLGSANSQGELYLTDVIAMAVADDVPVRGVPVAGPDEAMGVNDRWQLAQAERAMQRRYARELLDRGVTLADPARFDLRGRLAVGRDVFIDVGAVFSGNVTLGDRVRIGPNAVISESWLGDDCTVHANCVIDGVIAGRNCEIGPFARLRPGTEFDERVKVGNFVEVKAGRLASGVKVNHLSYVGDTNIGRDSNIGAGAVTCNYDGANKHRTEIGDRVFVGSGSMLVAPLTVGEGATIAAGSTITRDVPAETLAVARKRQSSVKGWKRPTRRGPAATDP